MPVTVTEAAVLGRIDALNADGQVDGILALPAHISSEKVIVRIDPETDVDGFHPINMGKLLIGDESGLVPCTPYGIHEMLVRSHIKIEGKRVVILARSNIAGKPLAALLMQERPTCNATVTLVPLHLPPPPLQPGFPPRPPLQKALAPIRLPHAQAQAQAQVVEGQMLEESRFLRVSVTSVLRSRLTLGSLNLSFCG